jgi:capsular polysaccharide biosynthesis protein
MARQNYTTVLQRGWFSITCFALLGLVVSLLVSFVQPLKYSSTVRLLVRQDTGTAVDAYTASRAEESIATNLTEILYTTTFFDGVMSAGFSIDPKTFPTDDYNRRKEWAKTISASVEHGSGLLTLTAYHQDPKQAEQIVRAAAFVLTQKAGDYTSGGHVTVQLIDAPLNSRWPVKPNLLVNGLSGLVLGGLFGVAYVLLQAERIRRRHQLMHEEA